MTNKYKRQLKGVEFDVYDVLHAFNVTNPARVMVNMYLVRHCRVADDGWIKWEGGKCPVDGHVNVFVKLGANFILQDCACNLRWGKSETSSDIIAYKIV